MASERNNQKSASDAILMQQAIGSCLSSEGAKHFNQTLKKMQS